MRKNTSTGTAFAKEIVNRCACIATALILPAILCEDKVERYGVRSGLGDGACQEWNGA